MDRFNNNEEIEYHPEAFLEGRTARLKGIQLDKSTNPYGHGTWPSQSFCAGWADADMDIIAKRFVVHARQDIPDLIAEVRRLQGETEDLLGDVKCWRKRTK